METKYGDHTEVSWLNRRNDMKKFFSLREGTRLLIAIKEKAISELNDPNFVSNLTVLTDLTGYLNMLSFKHLDPKQIILIVTSVIFSSGQTSLLVET